MNIQPNVAITGLRIKSERLHKDYSQNEVALSLNISQNMISRWERGIASPTTEHIVALAKLFDVSVDWLLGRSGALRTSHSSAVMLREVAQQLPQVLDQMEAQVPQTSKYVEDISETEKFLELNPRLGHFLRTRHVDSVDNLVAKVLKKLHDCTEDPESTESINGCLRLLSAPFTLWPTTTCNASARLVSQALTKAGMTVSVEEGTSRPPYVWLISWIDNHPV